MKWSEFKKLVDAEVSRNSGLSIYNPFDPEIEKIDIGIGDEDLEIEEIDIDIIDGRINIAN